nr:retrovirus-related Pol polyprotein from transposon TNT 1-94 [Tanacetum cinerariifolium]
MSSPGAPSAGPSTPPNYFSGPSTPLIYSSGPSTPANYSSGSSRNAECSNCKHLRDTRGAIDTLRKLPDHAVGWKNPWSELYTQRSLLKKEKRPFYMERTKYEDVVLFEVVVVSKAGNDEEEEKMLTRKMRTIGLNIKEVVGEAFNLKEEVEDEDELTLLMARHDEQKERMEPWHIDSAASNHMTGEEDLFVEMEIVKGMVHGLDQIDHSTQVCEGCILEKHDRTLFPKEATLRAKEPLQLIHTDLCGLVTLPSHEETGESGEKVQQPQSPTSTPNPTSIQDFPSSSSEGEPKKSSLQEIYEVTDEIPLLCLYYNCEPLVFEEAMKSKKWRQAMDEEIKSIEKNDT